MGDFSNRKSRKKEVKLVLEGMWKISDQKKSSARCKILKKCKIFSVIIILVCMMSLNCRECTVDAVSDSGTYEAVDGIRKCVLQDGVVGSKESYGRTEVPKYEPLQIHSDGKTGLMAASPYYKVFFAEGKAKMVIDDAWIEIGLKNSELGEVKPNEVLANKNRLSVCEILDGIDYRYTVETEGLTGELVLKEGMDIQRIMYQVDWEGLKPVYEDDGGILFCDDEGEKVVKILAPFMRDTAGVMCEDIHYELIETESGYELHKVIGETGVEWLKEAVYPVIIDPSMQVFGDAWGSSGLTPNGIINPATGRLSLTQTDLVIPGRGLDLVISRMYETPAVFYGMNPYDYEYPPVTVGNGWSLDFPCIGDKYVHLFGNEIHKIEWSNSTFENHKGTHFVLVKNGDTTYTLTVSDGTVYEFDTQGDLTQIRDLNQNSINFSYESGNLTTITDTIGRTVSLTYSNGRLWKILYNNAELEYSYDVNGCLKWIEDMLDRRISYSYNTGYNNWLISKITYSTGGYTAYWYDRFSDGDYYRYYVTDQRLYETSQVSHVVCSYSGSFEGITACTMMVKDELDTTQGPHSFTMNGRGLITATETRDASGSLLRKYTYVYNERGEITEKHVYYDGSTVSFTEYYAHDDWGNTIYVKNAEGHERFFSYANTSTSGIFIDNTGTVIQQFSNAFSSSPVPSSVHTALLGVAENQDSNRVKEAYVTYDEEGHPVESRGLFGSHTTWLTFSGTFNEKTGQTSFPVDLTGHTVAGNAVLEISGLPSEDIYSENHSRNCPKMSCGWMSGYWSGTYYSVLRDDGAWNTRVSVGPFTHYPGTLGYQSYLTNPPIYDCQYTCKMYASTFTATTRWKAYPAQVEYNCNNSPWVTISGNVQDSTVQNTVPGLINGQNTVNFSESSAQQCTFSWVLYVPVDNTLDTYTTTGAYDSYGNLVSVTDPGSNMVTLVYSPSYSYAYLTEVSKQVGEDIIKIAATYDYYRGWVLSLQQPKGVEAGSGYDYLYTYDVAGRIIKMEYPLLPGQEERSHVQVVYDCENRKVTSINELGHYSVQEYDKVGRLQRVNTYTGVYGSGTLYATLSYAYQYDNRVSQVTDFGGHTTYYEYDFLGRNIHSVLPDSSSIFYEYDDQNNKVTVTGPRGYDKIYWLSWLGRLTKVEEEYAPGLFGVTTYQYDEIGHMTSLTDAETHTTSYVYDSFFGLTKTVYPDTAYEEYGYDDTGNMVSFTDANGDMTEYTYDALQKVTQIVRQDQTVSFFYDANGNRTRMVDNALSTGDYVQYGYDAWNRLITETRHLSERSYTVSYQYDDASRVTKVTYPDGMEVLYSYDDLNRMTEIERYVDGSHDEILLTNVQYDTESLLTQYDYGNGLQAMFTHDSNHRILTLDVKQGETAYLDLDYTWDSDSNIAQLVNSWKDTNEDWNSDTESYWYDGLDRLVDASSTSWSHSYSYDKAGNRTGKDGITYSINAVNQVTGLSDGTVFSYDENGNMVGKMKGSDTWEYMYDSSNGLTRVEKNDMTIGEYVYDGNGRRILVIENSTETVYVYSGLNVLYEETATGTANYVYGPTGRLAKKTTIEDESHMFYYHTDHLGSTRLVTDESADIVVSTRFEPFGENTSPGEESYLFTGKEQDETGLYYYGARYYDPELGRFTTRDPLAGDKTNPQSLNLYGYCVNNPLKLTDPTGMFFKLCLDNGNCLWIFETGPRRGQWTAKDAEGNEITTSEKINEMLRNGQILEAMVKILQFLGFDVDESNIHYDDEWRDEEGNVDYNEIKNYDKGAYKHLGHIEFDHDGRTIRIDINIFGKIGAWGQTRYNEVDGSLSIEFYISTNTGANEFLQVIGHECIHLYQHLSGRYSHWVTTYGPAGAEALAEIEAHMWNVTLDRHGLTYLYDMFEGSQSHSLRMLREYTDQFMKGGGIF
ncbi:MAG: RHS repeat-associated core domain-containing protein [Candidatus Methanofastidiosia archaeon]